MAKWTDYTTDTNPTDTDEVMTLDADKTPKANNRVTLSTLADYFLDKLASKVFAKLETENKTVIGALNELNSNGLFGRNYNVMDWNDIEVPGIYSGNGETAKNAPNKLGWLNAIALASNANNQYMSIIAWIEMDLYTRKSDRGVWGEWSKLNLK